ncbi:MAG: hydrogenase expression/formation protein HypE [Spirochaetales bacterium]|nr:hydrogenase expression/formation protein HypE [Spirochaetales bacterium]
MGDKKKQNSITLAHGNGGRLTHQLIDDLFISTFGNPILNQLSDGAVFTSGNASFVFTTDAYVVHPLFFPGGDIGTLAVSGTVNDISVMGAQPLFLSAAFVIEEGFSLTSLSSIAASMQKTAGHAGVSIVTGDTKVVEKGKVDGLFITTSGIGIEKPGTVLPKGRLQDGDLVIISGTIGDHGIAVLTARENFPLTTQLKSDCAPLNGLIESILKAVPPGTIRLMRDPTRGGLATTLNEFVEKSSIDIEIEEERLPVKNEVKAICEMTGYDPLYIANEGKVVVVAEAETGSIILDVMKRHPLGKDACIIGRCRKMGSGAGTGMGKVFLKTTIGGERVVDMLHGDMFPRIC